MKRLFKNVLKLVMCVVVTIELCAVNKFNLYAKSNEFEVYSEEEAVSLNNTINELRSERAKYISLDNNEMVEEIDRKLNSYGVEQVDVEDIQKFVNENGAVSTCMLPDPVKMIVVQLGKDVLIM